MSSSTIAIIGASNDRSKYSNRAVRAYQQIGYVVYPVHPSEETVEGLSVYRTARDIPASRLDRVSLYVSAKFGLKVLDDLVGLDIGELWLNPGADDPEVVAKARELGFKVITGCSLIAAGFWEG